jgi:tetratricopeptide (TPR) repeat protein
MPSHIFSMLGDWSDLIQSDERALAAWEAYAAKNFGGATLGSNLHSMDFLEYAYLQTGQDAKAKAIVDKRNAIAKWGARQLGGMTGYAAIPVRYAIERGAWAEAAALPPMQTDFPAADAMIHFGRAYGAARSGHPEAAALDIAKLEALGNALTEKKDAYWAGQVQIEFGAAKAWVARAEGRNDEALKFMRLAADLEDKSEKHIAMENRLIPMRELLGDMLLETGDAAGALAAYETSLLKAPARFRSYWGAAQAAEKLGDIAKAKSYYGKLVAMGMDGARPELAQARVKLAAK